MICFICSAIYYMILKILKGVWFISLLAAGANLLYVYASLPGDVAIHEEELYTVSIGRESLFYTAMVLIGVVNLLVYLFHRSLTPDEGFRMWLHGLVISLNIFFVIGFSFIALYNSAEKFDFSRLGIFIYSAVGLVIVCALTWPVILVVRRVFPK